MEMQKELLERLRQELEAAVHKKIQTPKDFEYLSECIFQKLHEKISPTTLKRLWGYIPETSTPRVSTLNLLAEFLDYQDWEAFCSQEPQASPSTPQEETAPPSRRSRNPLYIALFALVAVVAISLIFFSRSSKPETDPADNKYVISIGDYFNDPYEYLRLFGVTGPQPYIWDITMPHHPALKLWGPTYHHPYWHNEGDSAKMLPTIDEYYINPDKPMEVSIMRNIAQYWLYLRINEIRLAFVKNLVDTGYVFTGAYRMSLEHSDTTHILWERVADEVDLEHLEYLENLRN